MLDQALFTGSCDPFFSQRESDSFFSVIKKKPHSSWKIFLYTINTFTMLILSTEVSVVLDVKDTEVNVHKLIEITPTEN